MNLKQLINNLNTLVNIQFSTKKYEKQEWTDAYNVLNYLNKINKAKNKTQILKITKELDNYLKQ